MARSRGGVRCQVFRGSQPVLAPEDASTAGVPPGPAPQICHPPVLIDPARGCGARSPLLQQPGLHRGDAQGGPGSLQPRVAPHVSPQPRAPMGAGGDHRQSIAVCRSTLRTNPTAARGPNPIPFSAPSPATRTDPCSAQRALASCRSSAPFQHPCPFPDLLLHASTAPGSPRTVPAPCVPPVSSPSDPAQLLLPSAEPRARGVMELPGSAGDSLQPDGC